MAELAVKDLVKRAKEAFKWKQNWEQQLRDVYKYAMPQRNLYDEPFPGQRKGSEVFDSSGIRALTKGASKVVSGLFPAGQDWCKLEAGPGVPKDQVNQTNEVLGEVTDQMFAVIHNASNFQTAIGEWALDLFSGMGGMVINDGDMKRHLLSYQAMPRICFAVDAGANGTVGGIFRKPEVLHRNILAEWPDAKLPDDIAKAANDEPNKPCRKLIEATYYDPKEEKWYYEIVRDGDTTPIVLRDEESAPWIVTRWLKAANEVEGRGPLLNALPDIKTINKLVELVLMNASLNVSGVWTGVDDGVLNPDTVAIIPGSVIPVARNKGHPAGASLAPLERMVDLDFSQVEHQRLQGSIYDMMHANALPPMDGPVRRPTEFIMRAKELSQDLGVSFGRLISEAVIPIVQGTLDRLMRQGVIQLPDEAQRLFVGGWNVKLIATSPLAQMQNLDEIEAVSQTIELCNALVGPDVTAYALKLEDLPEYIAQKMGFPAAMMRDDQQKEQVAQMVAQMMASQQMQEGGGNLTRIQNAAGMVQEGGS